MFTLFIFLYVIANTLPSTFSLRLGNKLVVLSLLDTEDYILIASR
jgi:hypothetical protein